MGVDLTLLPATMGNFLARNYSVHHTLLPLEQRHELWDRIRDDVPVRPVPDGTLHGYLARREDGETCCGEMTADLYGNPYTYATAGDLSRCISAFNDGDPPTPHRNAAALAYLEALPADWPVVLYWH